MSEKVKKLTPVEVFKAESNYLRGEIAEELVDENDFFGKASIQLLKHHGTYQQDNRDVRGVKDAAGKPQKSYMFMVRTKIPGGRITSEQLLAELDLCEEVANGTLRITSRQGLQLHGVLKNSLKRTIRRIEEIKLSTLAACGDVERNVMCTPAPYKDEIHDQMQQLAADIAERLCPQSTGFYEIWLQDLDSGEKELVAGGAEVIEPIYGSTYLPRKFKTAVALPSDNNVDLYTHDCGLMAIVEEGKIVGYNMLVGGGQGVTPSAKKTFPALGKPLAFATPEQVIDVLVAVIKVQRDNGDRTDRKVARLKYLIANWGIERFRAEVEKYYGSPLTDPRPIEVTEHDDHMGWHEQGDGRWFYGLNVENGRIKDEGSFRLKSALRAICTKFSPGIRLTPHQGMIFADVEEGDRNELESILREHGVPLTEEISNARRWSMACVAWPTCGLSITESERALPSMIDELDVELEKLGLTDEKFTVRMTGCPNGCARPYNSDIGIVGKAKEKYTILLGGRLLGDRLNTIYQDMVPVGEVVPALARVFAFFKQHRESDESFGDFCHRRDVATLASQIDDDS
jgi:sulfite reductase (ferredoxin)